MSVLKIKDDNGNWVGVPSVKGEKGEPGETAAHASRHFVNGSDPITPSDIGAATVEQLAEVEAKASQYEKYDAPLVRAHINNKENPHGVSCAQIGAATKEEVGNISSDISNGRVLLDQFSSERLGYSEQVELGGAMVDLSERISALVISVGDIQERLGM